MTDKDVISRVSDLLGVKFHTYETKEPGWKTSYSVLLRGKPACDLMVALKPLMGERRRRQIEEALATYEDRRRPRKLTDEQAQEIKERYRAGEKARSLGNEFGVSHWLVYSIHQGRSYA